MKALAYVEKTLQQSPPLSHAIIQKINGLVMGEKDSIPYRQEQNIIKDSSTGAIVYMPPEPNDVHVLMDDLLTRTNHAITAGEIAPPIIASIVHYQFATIHPYMDGNGRTARLITTYVLHQMGYGMQGMYSLEEYYAKDLMGYYDALTIGDSHNYYFGRENADITKFIEYFVNGMVIAYSSVERAVTQ